MAPNHLLSAKRKLKRAFMTTRSKIRRWRKSFGAEEFARLVGKLGVTRGDTLLVHSSLSGFEGYRDGVPSIIRILQESVGPKGTILMPTQPFQGTAVDYVRKGEMFDVARTPSKMGIITEVFRRSPGVVRSVHPTHPVAVWGAGADDIIRDHYRSETPCGKGTPYARFGDRGGKILLLGTGINCLTYYHSLEEDIEGRIPVSPFTEETFDIRSRDANREIVQTRNRLFEPGLSRLRDMRPTIPYFKARGVWRDGWVGTLYAILLSASDLRSVVYEMLDKDEYCYHLERLAAG